MTRGSDWYAFHASIDPINDATALRLALDDPQQRWYGLRRIGALSATGALVAASWNPNLHPRGRDGKFIDKFSWVRWFDPKTLEWRHGWVSDIRADDGRITVRSAGEKFEFDGGKFLYSRPKPKALLSLPDPTDPSKLPDKFEKVGGQGGSNPGALYQVDGSFADGPPDISSRSKMFQSFGAFRQPGTTNTFSSGFDPSALPDSFVPADVDTVMVPRVDGTLNRYDVLQRSGNKWFRVPASGTMEVGGGLMMRPELEVSAADAFGQPGEARRHHVLADLGTVGFTRAPAFDVEDMASMVQQSASPMPEVGDKFYVKKMNVAERARSEALANDLYELLGIPVPEVAVGADGTTISSKLVGDTTAFNPNDPQHVAAAQDGFIGDAWLANWDVIGMGYDNIQIDSQGRAWRIDAGGSLEYRAKGTPKGANFGDNVGELDSLRNKPLNPTAGAVFAGITDGQLLEQATVLQSISPDEIQNFADQHDMSHVGPVLIARRKSILDQLGIVDPPPGGTTILPSQPQTVFNPVEAVQQMGAPPTVAVDNWNLSYKALPDQTVDSADWEQPQLLDAIWKRDGDLWVYDSDLVKNGSDSHTGLFRNLFTGEKKRLTLYDGDDKYLTGYDKNVDDALLDNATVTRDLAISEIVARTTSTPLEGLTTWNVNKLDDPDSMKYGMTGLSNWNAFQSAVERGRFGKDNDRPLLDSKGNLWEIVEVYDDETGSGVILKGKSAGVNTVPGYLVTSSEFANLGPWYMPDNDTTGLIWRSKYAPEQTGDSDPDGVSLSQQSAISLKEQGIDDPLAHLGPDGGINLPGDDGVSDAAGVTPDEEQGMQPVYDDVLGKIMIPEANVLAWMKGEWKPGDPDPVPADAAPDTNAKIVHGIKAALSPGHLYLSTEMALDDLDAISAELLGKNVVTLPAESYENPDWEAVNLGSANGLGTVTSVETKKYWDYSTSPSTMKETVVLKVEKPYGGFSWVIGDESTKWPKVVIPVETSPVVQQTTLKKNGDIFINGIKVGTHNGGYAGTIDGDHSLTGKPMQFSAGTKAGLRNAASSLVVPIPPKPTKPKSTKIVATEEEIKALNVKLGYLQVDIEVTEQALENAAKGIPEGPGNPLNDGTKPEKGDWVFSTKDGTWAQVLNPNVVGFAGKGVLSPDMIKVKIQDPLTGKWKQSNRKRDTLVSAAGPGAQPFVLQTKAIKDANGAWIGPGTSVVGVGAGFAGDATILDTTTSGEAKVAMPDGSQKWIYASSHLVVSSGADAPVLKTPPGSTDAAGLNASLAALNDEKAQLVATIANTVVGKPKKKKDIGTPFPGPGGSTYKQPSWLAENREAKGLKNMKDGYVPTTGMIMRHNDGTQYVVVEMGDDWSTHKNSVRVAPVDNPSPYAWKWRAVSTMVVDHEALLTDKNGDALPIISQVDGADWAPDSGLVVSKPYNTGYYQKDPVTGQNMWRTKTMARYFIVGYDGTVYNVDGTKAYANALLVNYNSPDPPQRIGYLDKSHQGGQKLTLSVQQHHNSQVGQIQYAVIHDPNTPAAVPLANQSTTPPTPPPAPAPPVPPVQPTTTTVPSPAAPVVPTAVSPTPAGELPLFTGKDPSGMEAPHPPTSKSSAGVPTFQPQGGEPTLDVAGLPGAHSVTGAIAQTLEVAKRNKQNGTKDWVGTYGLADHDVIEDMMVRSQTTRDPQGVDYVEVSFRVEANQARTNHTTFITSTTNEAGDWEIHNRNATNLVPGDLIAVRVASGGGVTPKGALRPDDNSTMPNATVTAAPVLIGKNKDGTLDVYRTQVLTAGGDTGYIDLEDRNGTDTVQIAAWDPTKPRTSNGNKDLNPNAKDDGWTVKAKQLQWDRAQSDHNVIEQYGDGVKKTPDYGTTQVGAGWTLQRDYQGAHVEYRTSTQKNSLDGQVTIRVKADDPDAERKISEAMELVGVSKEKQKPPDKAALMKMATDKVWVQFNPTYTRGKTPNSPDQALQAIDAAVGPQLGRPATMADISLRVQPDGRVQVLVSEDVAKAIVKKNKITSYTHRFAGGVEDTVMGALTGVNPGLMATTERWAHGYFFFGMSSTADHGHDSADHLFLRMSKSSSISSGHAVFDPVVVHRHVDYYWQPQDSFGTRQSNQLNWLNSPSPGGSNELMLSRRLDPSLWGQIVVAEPERTQWIKKLHAKGITKAPNGQSLEDYFVTSGSPSGFPPTRDFGAEIPLTSIPEAVPAPALAGV